jgi:hypothetical protein
MRELGLPLLHFAPAPITADPELFPALHRLREADTMASSSSPYSQPVSPRSPSTRGTSLEPSRPRTASGMCASSAPERCCKKGCQ